MKQTAELVASLVALDVHVLLEVEGAVGIIVGFVTSRGAGIVAGDGSGIGLVGQ